MVKKVLIGLGIIVLVMVLAFAWMNYRSRSVSPPEITAAEINGFQMEINYSRPTARGRLIFGSESDGALIPHGKILAVRSK
jgi:hypothetical protein